MQDDIILQETKRSRFNWKIFGIIMTAVAVAGLVFGIAMLVTRNNDVTTQGSTASGSEISRTGSNAVITAEAPAAYTLSITSTIEIGDSHDHDDNENYEDYQYKYVSIRIENGEIIRCSIEREDADEDSESESCQVNGVNGKIYKPILLTNTMLEGFKNGIGFIMTDGTVQYVPVDEQSGNTFNVKGTLKIDGFVVDGIGAGIKENIYSNEAGNSGWATLLILNDGKTLRLDAAMLEGM